MAQKSVALLVERRPEQAQALSAREPPDPAAKFRAAAQRKALKALKTLAWLMENASSEAVRASAANSVLDRAYGRAAPAVRVGGSAGGEDAEGVEVSFVWLSPEKS